MILPAEPIDLQGERDQREQRQHSNKQGGTECGAKEGTHRTDCITPGPGGSGAH